MNLRVEESLVTGRVEEVTGDPAAGQDLTAPRAGEYVPRRPETMPLYAVQSAEPESFLARRERKKRTLPHFVAQVGPASVPARLRDPDARRPAGALPGLPRATE